MRTKSWMWCISSWSSSPVFILLLLMHSFQAEQTCSTPSAWAQTTEPSTHSRITHTRLPQHIWSQGELQPSRHHMPTTSWLLTTTGPSETQWVIEQINVRRRQWSILRWTETPSWFHWSLTTQVCGRTSEWWKCSWPWQWCKRRQPSPEQTHRSWWLRSLKSMRFIESTPWTIRPQSCTLLHMWIFKSSV